MHSTGSLEFLKSGVLATAATCGNILRLPCIADYTKFNDALVITFLDDASAPRTTHEAEIDN